MPCISISTDRPPGDEKAPASAGAFLSVWRSRAGAVPASVFEVSTRSYQWKLSPQAHEPVALGLSIVNPCFSMVSTKSIVAPLR
jgi:hypothetical protein